MAGAGGDRRNVADDRYRSCPQVASHKRSHVLGFPRSALLAFRDFADAVDRRLVPEQPGRVWFSPVDADLSMMPPTLIQASSTEILYPDAVLIAQRLAEAGARCVLQVWDGQPHVFQAGAGVIPEADRAIAQIGAFIRQELPGIRAVPPRPHKPLLRAA